MKAAVASPPRQCGTFCISSLRGDYGWEAISKTFDMTQREVIGWYSRILIKVRKKAGSVKMGIDQEKVA
jgi:hypothetical protein